jgi:hypothetical protein
VTTADERRERARAAWFDRYERAGTPAQRGSEAVAAAIEAAIRVRVDDVVFAAAWDHFDGPVEQLEAIIGAAFGAAGFEVEK